MNEDRITLLTKQQVVDRIGVTYPSIWQWMVDGKFPRPRVLGGHSGKTQGRSVWLASEVEQWIKDLPRRALKGDAPSAGASS